MLNKCYSPAAREQSDSYAQLTSSRTVLDIDGSACTPGTRGNHVVVARNGRSVVVPASDCVNRCALGVGPAWVADLKQVDHQH